MNKHSSRIERIRGAAMLLGALALFLVGLLLLLVPARAETQPSNLNQLHCPCSKNGWIMGTQSRKPISLAGG